MNDVILTQFYPLEHRLGRFAFANRDNKNFIEEFKEQIRVSDFDCRSIFMMLENDGKITPNYIKSRCLMEFYDSYEPVSY